ncbi:helix-turn-helix domain-containing protein [Sporolactobacillus putidus]|uniref:Uncharacterized protein n=1 Tax=Sporolactobacillus putidus TaxID=492735 RepID=A0A917S4W5_9BACL|nr:helix-turn-helix transcriptional regulator [Sporolactobacillus putidus]GGL55759.1 hypothetical protein GCM10007968_19810 [Sporolactobacillus putidus]
MKHEEIDQLYMKKRRKKITNNQCAEACGCTASMISYYFNHKHKMSEPKQDKLKKFIEEYPEYAIFKVAVKSKD